ncbi:uncharacterized protein LOC118470433 [Amphiprion ocellaris]|uniref:uncharacterized protein LOC118470433 n=1 Tax=Amphiprion ocellaris TaxID=80972 RepID=UPI00241119ED|nr:uncharacterized protein LOC118470433 [Amphiprion ocellaris]
MTTCHQRKQTENCGSTVPGLPGDWMDFAMFSHKRPLFDGYENQPSLYTKKRLARLETLVDRLQTDRSDEAMRHKRLKTGCDHQFICETCSDESPDHLTDTLSLSDQTSSWADAQRSVRRVLERLRLKHPADNFLLSDSVNKKFLEFRHDITEECGPEDKQHSWAVIEKQEEVIMYGPYYPNYNNGEHSEDVIIKQTQELLEVDCGVSEDWKVYVFTMNSPCLARNTEPCMLNLVHKAQEWWSLHGVKTHIGFVRCWGFKGTKENLFKDLNYKQVECVTEIVDYESYVKAAEQGADLNLLCEDVFAVTKHLLKSGRINFPLTNAALRQDWKSYFKCLNAIFEIKPEEERKILTQEANGLIEAIDVLLSGENGSFEEHLERGRAFALDHSFGSGVDEALQEEMRLLFLQCWREMVQDRYAEFIREKLTEDFNQCTVQLFIADVLRFTEEYLHIGKLQFLEDDSEVNEN